MIADRRGEEPGLRLTPLPFHEWGEKERATLLPYLRRPEVYLSGAPDAPPMPVVLELFARHLALSRSWLPFTEMLAGAEAKLEPEHRELLILRVAWRTGSGYEWRQHRRMAVGAGLSPEKVDLVAEGASAAGWSPAERSLLAAADELVDDFRLDRTTWASLATHFDDGQMLELLFVVGGYLCLALALNSIGVEAEIGDRSGAADRSAGRVGQPGEA